VFPSWLISALPAYDLSDWEPSDARRTRELVAPLRIVLAKVPDVRRAAGVRHELVAILLLSVLAVLCGVKGTRQAHRWANRLTVGVRLGLGLRRGIVPARSTWRDALKDLDGDAVQRAIGAYVQDLARQVRAELADAAAPGRVPPVHVALDGKAMRGARKKYSRYVPMLVAAFEPATGMVLAQHPVPKGKGKGGEIGAALDAIDQISGDRGFVYSLDALHAQDNTAAHIIARGAHYLVGLKGNRRTLFAQVKRVLWDEVPVCVETEEINKGRLETRTTRVIDAPAWLDFPGVAQVVQVTRTRKPPSRPGPAKKHVFYYLTSLTTKDATGSDLHAMIRQHWSVETLHQIRDVLLGEDAHKVRTGVLPRLWATWRNLAISLIRLAGHTRYKEVFENNQHDLSQALRLIT